MVHFVYKSKVKGKCYVNILGIFLEKLSSSQTWEGKAWPFIET